MPSKHRSEVREMEYKPDIFQLPYRDTHQLHPAGSITELGKNTTSTMLGLQVYS